MLLRVVSDVHLEQYRHQTVPDSFRFDLVIAPLQDDDEETVLVLAGDICEFGYLTFFADAFKELARRFKAVIYVPGNHEYFGNTAPYGNQTFFYYKELLRKWGKIYLLDDSAITIEGQTFYGTTLWTNYDDSPTAAMVCSRLGDFNYSRTYVGADDSRITRPQDYIDRYTNALAKLTTKLETSSDLVVISHFAPSHLSIHPQYADCDPYEINLHFANRLDDLIMDSSIKLWVHGHTHNQFNYTIGSTRVVCNPTGFRREGFDRPYNLTRINLEDVHGIQDLE